jgi:hypothetical protein
MARSTSFGIAKYSARQWRWIKRVVAWRSAVVSIEYGPSIPFLQHNQSITTLNMSGSISGKLCTMKSIFFCRSALTCPTFFKRRSFWIQKYLGRHRVKYTHFRPCGYFLVSWNSRGHLSVSFSPAKSFNLAPELSHRILRFGRGWLGIDVRSLGKISYVQTGRTW